jgi:hypothetical protein
MKLLRITVHAICLALSLTTSVSAAAEPALRDQALAAMHRATDYFRTEVAKHGGYVYFYNLYLSRSWGEGETTRDQIWVQQPGTPTVGLAYLEAFYATGDSTYLDAARKTAEALLYGQLESGGWTNVIDFDPQGKGVARYRNGRGGSRNHSSLDDGVSQDALRFLMRADSAFGFTNAQIHEASEYARNALFAAQFESGAFPQGWSAPTQPAPGVKASYPEYDWRTENRIKNYWDLPTLNDDLALHMVRALSDAWEIYGDKRALEALARLGDFLLLAQMPDPQPGWAQQYDFEMRPVWARKFEPPAIAGGESQSAIQALLRIFQLTGQKKYLEPIPRALTYLKSSALPNGQLARFYELRTNKPLYMTSDYQLTHDDGAAPRHYGWKVPSRLPKLESDYTKAMAGKLSVPTRRKVTEPQVRAILASLDEKGRWVSIADGESLIGQNKFAKGESYLSSEVFSENLEALSEFVKNGAPPPRK